MTIDPYARNLGARLISRERGRAVVELRCESDHCNDVGTVHGGAIFGLADVALATASNSVPGELVVAINGSVIFFGPARAGDLLQAEAFELERSERLGRYRVVVTCGERTVAHSMASTLLVGHRDGP